MDASRSIYDHLLNRISTRAAQVGVIGLGYVGLPLAVAVARAGFPVSGFDIEAHKVESLNNGQSYIEAVTSTALAGQVASGRFRATADFAELAVCEVIIICVPTPLTKNREPDLSFVRNTAGTIAKHLRPGQLVVLESTTYPGTTDDVIKPILEETGLRSKIDFFLGFSPEREDPGNRSFEVATIPKVVAGDGIEAATLVQAFYHGVVKTVVPVSTTATAEAVKLTENIFRSVNIALVNELKVVLGAMGIDIWEVIEAAKSKPFGYMPFYPGPGLGGHCVPIDPFYLTWKAREYELPTRFIELAAEINTAMPRHVVDELAKALDQRCGKALSRSRILIVGLAYKKNVPDIRESPSLRLIELIEDWGGKAEFHDPHVIEIPTTREHMAIK
ncbi:nucleotide sugar dehydrogenase, partial [Mesorhizobium sp. M2A.F.Ca.ET.037.01.1.1]